MKRRSLLILICAVFATVLGLCQAPIRADGQPVVRMYVFTSPECAHCVLVQRENLDRLAAKTHCTVEVKYFDIEQTENYAKLVDLEAKSGDTDNAMPVVFIDKDVIGGEAEVRDRLESAISKYAAMGGVWWPGETPSPRAPIAHTAKVQVPLKSQVDVKRIEQTPAKVQVKFPALPSPVAQGSRQPVYMAFFYEFGCKECERGFYLINYIKKSHPSLVVKEFDLSENANKVLYEAIASRYGVPETKRLVPATMFVGSEYLQMRDIKLSSIKRILKKYEAVGSPCPWKVKVVETVRAERGIRARFMSLGPLTVVTAGLLDGINPCAFTTLIFLISYLMYRGKKGKDILAIGASFAAGVFVAYFGIGCGAFECLKYLTGFHGVARVINILVAVGAIMLGALSFMDFLKARRADFSDITLQLPSVLKKRIHATVRESMGTGRGIAAAFAAGLVVSVLELACTGQVYLPTIIYVANSPHMRTTGLLYLALYNLMFILPLVGIFVIAYRGTSSEFLSNLAKGHVAPVKLGTALLFIALGVFLILSMG